MLCVSHCFVCYASNLMHVETRSHQSVSQPDGAAEQLSNLKYARGGTTHRHDISSTG